MRDRLFPPPPEDRAVIDRPDGERLELHEFSRTTQGDDRRSKTGHPVYREGEETYGTPDRIEIS